MPIYPSILIQTNPPRLVPPSLGFIIPFHKALNKRGPVSGNRKPQPQSWMAYSIGRIKFNLCAVMIRPKQQIRSELYISGNDAKAFFHLPCDQKDAIEQALGYSLEWGRVTDASRNAIHLFQWRYGMSGTVACVGFSSAATGASYIWHTSTGSGIFCWPWTAQTL